MPSAKWDLTNMHEGECIVSNMVLATVLYAATRWLKEHRRLDATWIDIQGSCHLAAEELVRRGMAVVRGTVRRRRKEYSIYWPTFKREKSFRHE